MVRARRRRQLRLIAAAAAALAAAPAAALEPREAAIAAAMIDDGLPAPLTETPGDPARGRAIVADRRQGLCLLCHSGPFPDPHLQGDLAPSLEGAGGRLSAAQLRLRLVDPRRLAPDTIMPAYFRADGQVRPAARHAGRPILDAQAIEDVVAYLASLK